MWPYEKKDSKGLADMKGAWTFSNIKGGGTLQPKYLWPLTLGPRRGLTRARILIFQCEKGRRKSTVLRKYYRLGNVRQSVAYWLWLENWDDKWREKGEMGKMGRWESGSGCLSGSRSHAWRHPNPPSTKLRLFLGNLNIIDLGKQIFWIRRGTLQTTVHQAAPFFGRNFVFRWTWGAYILN